MSIEIHALSNQQLPSIAAWQKAIDTEGFNLKLDSSVEFATASGFLPAMLPVKQFGFECFHDDVHELLETYQDVPDLKSSHPWKHVLSFRWGSFAHEGVSVFIAATAYAQATTGVVFDP